MGEKGANSRCAAQRRAGKRESEREAREKGDGTRVGQLRESGRQEAIGIFGMLLTGRRTSYLLLLSPPDESQLRRTRGATKSGTVDLNSSFI